MGPILRTRRSTRMDRHAATRRLPTLADQAGSVYPGPAQGHALRPRPQNLDRHPNYILAAYMASGT